jgi:hypothetical protein
VSLPARRLGAAGACAALILAIGCATSTAAQPNRFDASPGQCRAGTPAPIGEPAFKRALAARGFRLHRDHDLCEPDPRLLVTLTDAGGYLYCFIYRRNIFGSRLQRFVWRNDPRPTYIRVLNLECGIYPDSRATTDHLERAFRRLPGVSSKSSTVPSAGAIHD